MNRHLPSDGGARTAALHPFLARGRTDILAHRGASDDHPPGNTHAAFAAAIRAGVDHLETDVQVSADGVVVVFHDDRLDDATTGTGTIADHDWAHLATLETLADGRPTGDRLVRLDELLRTHTDAFFNIDIKTDAAVAPTVRILVEASAGERVCVAAFTWRRLRRIRHLLGPGWCSALSKPEIAIVRLLAWFRLPLHRFGDVVQLPPARRGITLVDRRFVDACHRSRMAVHVWTVNDTTAARQLYAMGVDAVITDRPAAMVAGTEA